MDLPNLRRETIYGMLAVDQVMFNSNDDELKDAVTIVNEHIQEIQNYLGQGPHADGKIRFPRNFIRTAVHFRNHAHMYNSIMLRISYDNSDDSGKDRRCRRSSG